MSTVAAIRWSVFLARLAKQVPQPVYCPHCQRLVGYVFGRYHLRCGGCQGMLSGIRGAPEPTDGNGTLGG